MVRIRINLNYSGSDTLLALLCCLLWHTAFGDGSCVIQVRQNLSRF